MDDNNFEALGIIEPIRRALETARIAEPTPVQREAIPLVLAGHDVVGSAQTGSGKTAAYALPMLQRLLETRTSPVRGSARALVLAPTRELAVQIDSRLFHIFRDQSQPAGRDCIRRGEQERTDSGARPRRGHSRCDAGKASRPDG